MKASNLNQIKGASARDCMIHNGLRFMPCIAAWQGTQALKALSNTMI
jgi:hypothetical protein